MQFCHPNFLLNCILELTIIFLFSVATFYWIVMDKSCGRNLYSLWAKYWGWLLFGKLKITLCQAQSHPRFIENYFLAAKTLLYKSQIMSVHLSVVKLKFLLPQGSLRIILSVKAAHKNFAVCSALPGELDCKNAVTPFLFSDNLV